MITYVDLGDDMTYRFQLTITGKDLNRLTYYAFGTLLKPEIKEWLENNTLEKPYEIDGGMSWFDLYFKNKDDALKFKLTWS